jgi:hypothetical protein
MRVSSRRAGRWCRRFEVDSPATEHGVLEDGEEIRRRPRRRRSPRVHHALPKVADARTSTVEP